MVSTILAILKILGIIILILLGIILTIVFLVLFVPIRYRITVHRKTDEEVPIVAEIRATWFFHILSVAFSYPAAAYVRVKVFCFTIFRSDESDKKKILNEEKGYVDAPEEGITQTSEGQNTKKQESSEEITAETLKRASEKAEKEIETEAETEAESKIGEFFQKLWSAIKNIKYTIRRICDKIKHIVNNTRYYIEILKSNTFKRAWKTCSGQVLSLLKSLAPRKIQGRLWVGTGDPASTGQVLAVYGMLYPLLGNHIDIIPDFEQAILECDLLIKGRITIFKALKTAWIVFFNRDLRRLIRLLKREAS
ncbi:MAG: DUF2953 domain-containing protein [Suilimivivens sp.]